MSTEFLKKSPVDIVIDFSSSAASASYEILAKAGVKIITAISKYSPEEINLVKKASQKTAVLASPNITLGINWLMIASKVLKHIIPHADIEVVEEHFRDKKEISGTALKLASHLELEPSQHVNSIRVGGIVGRHEVIFGLPYQTIRITHESINRAAFGTGAVFAGKWLHNKPAGFYTMEQVIHEKFLKKITELTF
jgi:4-hydroxy-tetrahydrodipicolinate reductase